MSDQEVHAVATAQGVRAVETEFTEPKAEPTAYRSETAGMSESQTAALAWIDANRANALNNPGDVQLQRQMKEYLDHAFRGTAAPASIAALDAKQTAEKAADHRPVVEGVNDLQFARELAPVESTADLEALVTRGVVAGQMDRHSATAVASFCNLAALPSAVANTIVDRAAKHVQEGFELGGALSQAETQDLAAECVRSFGSLERAVEEADLARAYIHSVGGSKLLAQVDAVSGSLGFDPRIILQLSYMARAAGITLNKGK